MSATRATSAETASAPGEQTVQFERDIRPILKANCFHCHGEGKDLEGDLDLRLRRLIVDGGDSGPAIIPGVVEESYLYERIQTGEMPPGEKKLTKAEVALIGRWIAGGAVTARPEPKAVGPDLLITAEERGHWAYQPIVRPAVPRVGAAEGVRNPVDAFLLARLEEAGMSFAPEADRQTLIRRAYFDLLGLGPTPEAVAAFVSDDQPGAYERLIDRLLSLPGYGERWGRHWLDVAGYADSEGYTDDDAVRKYAYKYRDYVIRSFNADKPFDVFIHEQLAGAEMAGSLRADTGPADTEKLIATGFLRMAPDGTGSGGVDQSAARNAVMAETINIVSTSLLGLTVGCAQCHHHRYDPISQTDYYRMRAIFEPVYDWKNWRNPRNRLVSLYTEADKAEARKIEEQARKIDERRSAKQAEYIARTFEKELARIPAELRQEVRQAYETPAGKRSEEHKRLLKEYPSVNVTAGSLYLYDRKAADELKKIAAEAAALRATKPVEDFVRAATEIPGKVPTTHVFDRGDPNQPTEAVKPRGLSILASLELPAIPENDPSLPSTGRRLAYAKRLTDGKHPLTSRVLMNRVWMYHFGRGIVASVGDFGTLGDRPTHPKLLDWLADEFMAGGWRLKRMHKLMMTSSAYRQSSRRTAAQKEGTDPDNTLYGRMSIRRMEAEVVRDAILAVSGTLNRERFGEPVPVMADTVGQVVVGVDTTDTAGRPTGKVVSLHGDEFRRSVYVQVRRSQTLAVLETFDAPIMEPNCQERTSSTVAPQALMLMNSDFTVARAEHFARRIRSEAGTDRVAQIRLAWNLAFGTEPTDGEVADALAYLADQAVALGGQAPDAAESDLDLKILATLCQALLSSNRFLYID